MKRFDAVSNWLNSVSYSHSQSKATEEQYKRVWKRFTNYVGKTAEQILAEYEASDDRTFRRKYAQYIRTWIANLAEEDLGITSIKVMVGAVKSFFKYNDLPLGLVPQSMSGIIYHNRDITKEEIIQIMSLSKIREKAFFVVMAQSGLRPHTIKQLRLKNLESFDKVPCKIEIPKEITKGKYGSYVTFIGSDAIKYLKQYLATRPNLAPDSLMFCSHSDPTKPVNAKDVSRAFRLAARKLEKSGAIDFEIRKGKPSELRFYTLRKFFRKQAHQMGFENVNYMMGHTVRGSDANYKPQDPEFYRKLYEEKAMPFLRLETATPTETEKTIAELKKQLEARDREIETMKVTIDKIQPLVEFVNTFETPQKLKRIMDHFFKDDMFRSFDKEDPTLLDKDVSELIDETAKERGLTQKEALEQLMKEELEGIVESEKRFKELAKKSGMPMSRKEYEKRRAERDKARAANDFG
jgi:site-specific recombinase XerD